MVGLRDEEAPPHVSTTRLQGSVPESCRRGRKKGLMDGPSRGGPPRGYSHGVPLKRERKKERKKERQKERKEECLREFWGCTSHVGCYRGGRYKKCTPMKDKVCFPAVTKALFCFVLGPVGSSLISRVTSSFDQFLESDGHLRVRKSTVCAGQMCPSSCVVGFFKGLRTEERSGS
jgi:hypothetical protein